MRGKAKKRSAFTGRHIAAILIAFFGVIMAVNFTMAYLASKTFGGLVVQNSYVASQKYNGWLEKARKEQALGWQLDVRRMPDHRLLATLEASAKPLSGATITALVRHPLGLEPERTLTFRQSAPGRYESLGALPAGRWIAHMHVSAPGGELNRIADLP
jgi:nitrogen fixation protein FixH